MGLLRWTWPFALEEDEVTISFPLSHRQQMLSLQMALNPSYCKVQ